MLLSEKLSNIREENNRQEEERLTSERRNAEAPILENIAHLNNLIAHLSRVRDSTDYKNEAFGNTDFERYSREVDSNFKKSENTLKEILEQNRDVLASSNINNLEELISNPDFAVYPEVVDYLNFRDVKAELANFDFKVVERLNELGVNFENENPSRDEVVERIEDKIKSLESEIRKEKVKTFEGRKEVVSELSNDFEKKFGHFEVGYASEDNFSISLGVLKNNINIKGEKAIFEKYQNFNPFINERESIDNELGDNISDEILIESFKSKVDKALDSYEKYRLPKNVFLKEYLESCSQDKFSEAQEEFRKLNVLEAKLKTDLKNKKEELEEKGIKGFPDDYVQGWGNYHYIFFTLGSSDEENINILRGNFFPAKCNYSDLSTYLLSLQEVAEKLRSGIASIESEVDIDNFFYNRDSEYVLLSRQKNIIDREFYHKTEDFRNRMGGKIREFRSFTEVSSAVEEKERKLNKQKESIISVFEDAINLESKKKELAELAVKNNFKSNAYEIKREMEVIERESENALKLYGEIIKLETDLPNEELRMDERHIIIVSDEKKINELGKEIEILRNKIKEAEQNVRKKRDTGRPKLFGVDKWDSELKFLIDEEKRLKDEYETKVFESDALYRKRRYFIPSNWIYNNFLKDYKSSGTGSEVFNQIKEKLDKIINRKVPDELKETYNEFIKLADKVEKNSK